MQACPFCHQPFDPLSGGYSPDGAIVCAPCAEKAKSAELAQQEKNKGSAFIGAAGSVLIALASFIVQFKLVFFLMPLLAIGFGGATAFSALANSEVKKALGWKKVPTIALGTLGVVLGLLSLVASFAPDEDVESDVEAEMDVE